MKLFTTFFFASALLTATSCTSEVTDSLQDDAHDNAIAFGTPQTKAAIEGNFPDGSTFAVWGWRSNGGTDISTDVFTGETVTSSDGSNWSYTGVRYWVLGETYNFYAVYPANNNATYGCDENGNITITNFNASATGADAVDLMTAEARDIKYDNADEIRPVGLTFNHLLAKVNIVAQSEGGTANISNVNLTGIKAKGSYDSSSDPVWTLDGNSYTFTAHNVSANQIATDLFGDLLLPPQEVNGSTLSITYSYGGGTPETRTATLPTNTITQWEAGLSYTYTLTLTSDYITFGVPTVNEWGEASGGIIIVD